jgi:hypothetical protein
LVTQKCLLGGGCDDIPVTVNRVVKCETAQIAGKTELSLALYSGEYDEISPENGDR